jgi:O-antigen ligase
VISRWFRLEKYLNYLLIFLLPTQLALHFWPPFAFVFGIRVDYLAPSIYLTDVLFLVLFTIWVERSYKKIFEFVGKYRKYIYIFLLVALLNTAFSSSVLPSIYKWVKLLEFFAFGFYVWARPEVFKSRAILRVLFYSLIFFSAIGVLQVILGATLGGPLYFLGERSFNASTPGIALADIFGRNFLRAYSTFSHPNSLAGYLGLGLLPILLSGSKKRIFELSLGFLIICTAFLLAFSLSALLGIIVSLALYILITRNLINRKLLLYIPAIILLISLSFPFVSKIVLQTKTSLSQNISQRMELSLGAGVMVSQKFLLGEGLNTFVINEPRIKSMGTYLWTLQPVHNIFLLVFSETGLVGLLAISYLLYKLIRKSLKPLNVITIISLTFILTTGLFDHYWFTLQQNMFLMVFVLANSFKAEA